MRSAPPETPTSRIWERQRIVWRRSLLDTLRVHCLPRLFAAAGFYVSYYTVRLLIYCDMCHEEESSVTLPVCAATSVRVYQSLWSSEK